MLHPVQPKNAQVATNLLTSCNRLDQKAGIRMLSHGLRQLVNESLLQVVNRLVASCLPKRVIHSCCSKLFQQVTTSL